MSTEKKKPLISDEMRQRLAAKAEADALRSARQGKIASIVVGVGLIAIGAAVMFKSEGAVFPYGIMGVGAAVLIGAAFGVPVTDFMRFIK